MKRTWWAVLGAMLLLLIGGCASYYEDRYYYTDRYGYYDDRGYYYTDGYHPRSRFARRYYGGEPYYYDLYDPYLSLFLPFGWAYDPWHYGNYHFGVQLYPYRHFGFAFYGGRPWFHSPWYGGYGLYYPYFYIPAQRRHDHGGGPTREQVASGPSASQAARGLAAGMREASPAPSDATLVRSTAVAGQGYDSRSSALLGTMSVPLLPGAARDPGSVRLMRMPEVDDSTGLLPSPNQPVVERGFAARDGAWRNAPATSDGGIPLGRHGFPLQAPVVDANPLQSVDDSRGGMPGVDPRQQRWSGLPPAAGLGSQPRLQRWPGTGPVDLPAQEFRLQRNDGAGWNGGRVRTDSGAAWQGRGDAFRGSDHGRSQPAPPVRYESPRGSFSAPRMESSHHSAPHTDHGRNQHEE